MIEILYPKLDRAVIITVFNLDGYYENTIFNNVIRVLDTKNTAYLLIKEDRNIVGDYARIVSAVIFCDEETSKKYKDISYKYWICVEILKRDEYEYVTEELLHRPGVDAPDNYKHNLIEYSISESKSVLNKIYKATKLNTNLIYVNIAHLGLRTPVLDTYGNYVARFVKYGKVYKFHDNLEDFMDKVK